MSGFDARHTQPWEAPWPLAEKVAVIVGGAGGIGLPIARQLDKHGCRLAIAGRNSERVGAAVGELSQATGYADCDIRQESDVDRLFDQVLEQLGQVDVVINCAGIGRAGAARLVPDTTANLAEAEWQEVVDTNLRGGFLVARRAARAMIPRRQGQIVNVSSARGAVRGRPFAAAYCATKMACLVMFQSLAEELRPLGIRAWSLLPDAVDTELIAGTNLAHRGAMAAEAFAEVVADLLCLPHDADWCDPLVAPFDRELSANLVGAR